ncbi:MAG: hypothetical protein P4M13_08845 [Alphaproteobacteria bacterium]|nr:hypothetical protein [Alphaproteobacteria bacterium]
MDILYRMMQDMHDVETKNRLIPSRSEAFPQEGVLKEEHNAESGGVQRQPFFLIAAYGEA